jgi:hypoxanthine phosphoribosyltransferase
MPDYLFINYSEWGEIMNGLVSQLKRLKKMTGIYDFTHVYAPPRGGLPIAVHLSHHLSIDMIEFIDPNYPPDWFGPNDNLLVIDDIVDTGKTFKNLKEMLDIIVEEIPTFQYKLASIHYKPRTIIKPDIFMQEISNDTWVVYPFENLEECGREKTEFNLRRKKELSIETSNPIVTATQIEDQDKQIWKSFLGEQE